MKKVITPSDLHNDDFDIDNDNKVVIKIDRLQFVGEWANKIVSGNPNPSDDDRLIIIQQGIGTIHLDFKEQSGHSGDILMVLPEACPTPMTRLEAQLYDGRLIYIDAGSREVKIATNLALSRRYVATLVGFFN